MAARKIARKSTPESETAETPKAAAKPRQDYVELKLPKLPFNLLSWPVLLGLLLLIGAYFLGYQTAKVNYLEKQSKEAATAAATDPNAPQASPTPQFVKVDDGHLPVLGNKNAKVTMVEFSDFQCPFCKQFVDNTFAQIKKDYIDTGKVKFVYRHFPLPIHPNAPLAANAAECANDQGKFWDMHDKLFATQDTWAGLTNDAAKADFISYAGDLGLDTTAFDSCLSANQDADKIKKDSDAATAAGVSATPTFVINGEVVVGALPYDSFKQVLDAKLK
jgi:protein-disulfide isomerase